jgi:TonB family protein
MQRQVRFADRLGQTSGGDVLGSPTAEKISADEKVPNADVTTGGNAHVGEREGSGAGGFGGSGEGVGSGDLGEGKGFGVGSVGGSPSGSVGIGAAVGKPIYSIEWRGQGTRSKTSGILPSFPQGVKKSAQIKIQVTVLPDGTTGQMMPIQKGDTQLEDSAMRALRSWKFAPLRQNEQQAEQTVVVTFYFKLE